MKDVRWLAAVSLAISIIGPTLRGRMSTDDLLTLLSVGNACLGIAGLYGWRATGGSSQPPPSG